MYSSGLFIWSTNCLTYDVLIEGLRKKIHLTQLSLDFELNWKWIKTNKKIVSKAFCKSSNALKNLLSLKLRGIRVAEADVHIVPTDPSNSEVRRILRKKNTKISDRQVKI